MARRGKAQFSPAPGKRWPVDPWTATRAIIIVLAGLWTFAPALRGQFLWDDVPLVAGNVSLRSIEGLGQIWFAPPRSDYWPLTWTLLWFEYQLWGNDPFPYHLTCLALHLTSALLIWRLLARLGLRWGWLGGLLFAVHPLAAESVAWISEIKNTLSLPFFLLACDAWLDADEGKPKGTLRSVLFYLAAMLAKTSTVALPVMLALYCWWKRGTVTRGEMVRLVPYIVIAVLLGIVTIHFQNNHVANDRVEAGDAGTRLARAGSAIVFYATRFVAPVGFMPVYPKPSFPPLVALDFLPLAGVLAVLAAVWTQRRGWGRHALFGVGFFLLTLAPVVGLVKMQFMRVSWVSDHLAYLPMIGLIGLTVATVERLAARLAPPARKAGAVLGVIVLGALAWESRQIAAVFVNADTLWTYALARNPDASPAAENLGTILMRHGQVPEAMDYFRQAIQSDPDNSEAHVNLGTALLRTGHAEEAEQQYRRAIEANPDYANAHNALAVLCMQTGRFPEAFAEYDVALRIDPTFADAHHNLASLLLYTGRTDEAISHEQIALHFEPDLMEAHTLLGDALLKKGRAAEAVEQYEIALRLNPNFPRAQQGLANARAALSGAAPSP
jgi:Flp pilus assembly protein TadD